MYMHLLTKIVHVQCSCTHRIGGLHQMGCVTEIERKMRFKDLIYSMESILKSHFNSYNSSRTYMYMTKAQHTLVDN